jgi:RNA polymerase sigma-70 factor (ECF subfamily)
MAITDSGDSPSERDELFAVAYRQLHALAVKYMVSERSGHTLQPTALVHEAYIKLKRQQSLRWASQTHFVALAARAMRQVLVDHARKKSAKKRDGVQAGWTITSPLAGGGMDVEHFLAVHRALERLAARGENGRRQARLIEYVWLGGMPFTEAAEELGVSRRTAHRDWAWARVWLEKELTDAAG